VAVTAGYVCPAPRAEFYRRIDAANVDLKAFTDRFYRELCAGDLATVLDTRLFLREQTKVWLEVTTLLIPGENDSVRRAGPDDSLDARQPRPECRTLFGFHADFRMRDKPPTSPETLTRARHIAIGNGLRYVYTGNVRDETGGNTNCANCGTRLVGRDCYEITALEPHRRRIICIAAAPVPRCLCRRPGRWGNRRLPLDDEITR